MQRALFRYLDDSYEEYFFSYGSCRGYNTYGSTEELLAHPGYSPDIIKLLCDNYASWVLVIGNSRDVVLYCRAAESGILAYGYFDTISDWVTDITRGCTSFLSVSHGPMRIGDLLRNNSVNTSLAFLQDLGLCLTYPPDEILRPIATDRGSEYWVHVLG